MSKLYLKHPKKSMPFFAVIKNLLLQNILARRRIINEIYIKVESTIPLCTDKDKVQTL
jgi:hypothetical protein